MEEADTAIQALAKKLEADIIIYSGPIFRGGAHEMAKITDGPRAKTVLLALCTQGGDPDAAFKIARMLQNRYKKVILYVYGYCKSAGTFLAIGSDEIMMEEMAEFGPLDVQLKDKDEIARFGSGLNIPESILFLRERVESFFRDMVMELTNGAGISTKMAADVASIMAIQFVAPIMSQINPVRLGETQRAINIAYAYGDRLAKSGRGNLKKKEESLLMLVGGYPDHGFVIDYGEALEIFRNVKKPIREIECIAKVYEECLTYPGETVIRKIYGLEAEKGGNCHDVSHKSESYQEEGGVREEKGPGDDAHIA